MVIIAGKSFYSSIFDVNLKGSLMERTGTNAEKKDIFSFFGLFRLSFADQWPDFSKFRPLSPANLEIRQLVWKSSFSPD